MKANKNTLFGKLKSHWKNHLKELKAKDKQAGASLVEILVAVAIMAILGTGIGIAVLGNVKKAQITLTKNNINTIKMAMESYVMENFAYPEEGTWKDEIGPYLGDGVVPPDPWDNDFIYKCPGDEGREYEIISMGPDKSEGTEDDITSYTKQEN